MDKYYNQSHDPNKPRRDANPTEYCWVCQRITVAAPHEAGRICLNCTYAWKTLYGYTGE